MNVISRAAIKQFAVRHADAADELHRWAQTGRRSTWRDLADVRQFFPSADQFKSLLIFNIRHNYYWLIVKVDYRAKLLMIKEFLTHTQYIRGDWKKWAR